MWKQSEVEIVPRHVIEEQNDHNRYTFPKSIQGIQKVQSKAQLDQILRGMFYVQFQSKGINIPYPYEIEQKTRIKNILSISKIGFMVRCRICTNFLTYSRDIDSPSSMFSLQSYYSVHDHRLTQERKVGYYDERVPLDYRTAKQKKIYLDLKRYGKSIDDIEKCIGQLPSNLMQKMRSKVICKHFNISINQFKNIYLKLNSKKEIEFSEFIEDLHKKNYEYRYLPEDLLKENPKFTRKYHQPNAFSVNPANHERKEDKPGASGISQINVDAKKTDSNKNLFSEQKGGNIEQTKTKGNFPLIDPNTYQIPKPTITNPSSSQPTGLNGNNPNIPLYKIDPNTIDPNNPNLPNVILIISPSMKQMYKKYGQYMGFDLTFSLIRQQPTHTEKEYLVGVFASKNESFRIVIFGLVVTNNQSAKVYKWLFKNFMQIMGKQPQTIITDEQVAIGRALKQLKQQGFYHGHHLLDTFHVLTKFRKAVESQTFQYLRKLIHAKDKYEYKALFEQCMNQLTSDDEIKVLQDFDYHCEKYCYAHIPPSFVGFGVSDAMNESFHNILKDKIPYEIKYLKAVNIMLPFLQQRNEIGTLSLICEIPYEQKFGFPFLKPYRKIVSDRLFLYLIHQCSKGITHSIILDDGKYESNECQKIQQEGSSIRKQKDNKFLQVRNTMQKSKFQVVTKQGICLVWKQKIPQFTNNVHQSQISCDPSTNYWGQYPQMSAYTTNIYPYSRFEPKVSQLKYKWRCICQMQQKAGLCCSHILKILILKNESLLPYIHPRWFVREQNIFQGLKSMMNRDINSKYMSNITTDMSNTNRLKSVRLRDKYVSARNNIKKELQEIVDVKIPLLDGEVRVNDLSRRRNLQNGSQGQNNGENAGQKNKALIQQQYMQWVSANDQTIKLQKQKYYKILQKKRKVEIKRLRRQNKLVKKGGHKFSLPSWGPNGNRSINFNNSQQKYVDYVYLKPREMKEIQGKKKISKNIEENSQSQEENQIEQYDDGDQMIENQKNSEQNSSEQENSQESKINENYQQNQKQMINNKTRYNKKSKLSQKSSQIIREEEYKRDFISEQKDFDQYFMQNAQIQNQQNQYQLQYQQSKNNNGDQDQYQNWEQYQNQYILKNTNKRDIEESNYQLYEKSIEKKQNFTTNKYKNPFKKLSKQQIKMKKLTTQYNQQNQRFDMRQDQQSDSEKYQRNNATKKRARPQIHSANQRLSQTNNRAQVSGQKKRGRPRKNHQMRERQQMNRLQHFTKLLKDQNYQEF